MLKKTLLVGIAALTMGGALATTTNSAQAQVYFGTGFYGGYPAYGGYYGGYRPVAYYGGYRPVGYYGSRYYYGGGYPYYRYRRSNGGAVAAGVVGGLALGALAATAARPYYARPVYGDCWLERRRTVNRWGNLVIRRVRVCS